MAVHPQRFIHAANLRLGTPVSIWHSEDLDADLQTALEDATLTALTELVEQCILQEVQFLLLSGNVFIEADRSLQARLHLLSGFRQLQEENIAVFVIPGEADPAEAWRAIPDLPDNVKVCYSSGLRPEELIRDDEVTTTVSPSLWLGEADEFGIRVIPARTDARTPFRIGVISRSRFHESRRMADESAKSQEGLLLSASPAEDQHGRPDPDSAPPADVSVSTSANQASQLPAGFREFAAKLLQEGQFHYLAFTGEHAAATISEAGGLIHCPGTTQPRSWSDPSCGLCSLVDVDEDGAVKIKSLETATVGWRTCEIDLQETSDLTSLLSQMRDCLLDRGVTAAERVVAVHWIIRGDLPLILSLEENDLQGALATELPELDLQGQLVTLIHQIRCVPADWPDQLPADSPAAQYQQHFRFPGLLQRTELERLIACSSALSESWQTRLLSNLDAVDTEQILSHVRRSGADWFEPEFGVSATDDLILPEAAADEDAEAGTELLSEHPTNAATADQDSDLPDDREPESELVGDGAAEESEEDFATGELNEYAVDEDETEDETEDEDDKADTDEDADDTWGDDEADGSESDGDDWADDEKEEADDEEEYNVDEDAEADEDGSEDWQ